MIERLFKLREAGTTVRTELIGRATTFVTLRITIKDDRMTTPELVTNRRVRRFLS